MNQHKPQCAVHSCSSLHKCHYAAWSVLHMQNPPQRRGSIEWLNPWPLKLQLKQQESGFLVLFMLGIRQLKSCVYSRAWSKALAIMFSISAALSAIYLYSLHHQSCLARFKNPLMKCAHHGVHAEARTQGWPWRLARRFHVQCCGSGEIQQHVRPGMSSHCLVSGWWSRTEVIDRAVRAFWSSC